MCAFHGRIFFFLEGGGGVLPEVHVVWYDYKGGSYSKNSYLLFRFCKTLVYYHIVIYQVTVHVYTKKMAKETKHFERALLLTYNGLRVFCVLVCLEYLYFSKYLISVLDSPFFSLQCAITNEIKNKRGMIFENFCPL